MPVLMLKLKFREANLSEVKTHVQTFIASVSNSRHLPLYECKLDLYCKDMHRCGFAIGRTQIAVMRAARFARGTPLNFGERGTFRQK